MTTGLPPGRKQLTMVLPEPLLAAMKQRAQQLGLTLTAYVSGLVRADLGVPLETDPVEIVQQLAKLQQRVDRLENQASARTEP